MPDQAYQTMLIAQINKASRLHSKSYRNARIQLATTAKGEYSMLKASFPILALNSVSPSGQIGRLGVVGDGSKEAAIQLREKLWADDLFREAFIQEFYQTTGDGFEEVKYHIEITNYWRLLIIEYLDLFQINQEVSRGGVSNPPTG